MKEVDFNLLDEPWIIVASNAGSEETLSLTDVLTHAHELRRLAGEMESQDVAILRLLLGVLYAIYTRTDEYQSIRDEKSDYSLEEFWQNLWERKHFPTDEINGYLSLWHDRFWLIHPERPFYQVSDLKDQERSIFEIPKMLGNLVESANKTPLFSSRTPEGKKQLSYPEAARWLIHLNGYDDGALKKVDRNTGSVNPGWLGQLGLVYAEGNNLFETLMLNFKLNMHDEKPWDTGYAAWELDEPRSGERTTIKMPTCGEELFTLQSRRILLKRENDAIVKYAIKGGDSFSSESAFNEPMTLWKERKGKQNIIFPKKEQNTSKQFWRDFSSLVIENEDENKRPGILKWLDKLICEDVLTQQNIKICTINVVYGNMSSGIDEYWSDSVSVNAGILSSLNSAWIFEITKVLELTGKLADCVGMLATDLELCKGMDEGEKRKNYWKVANEAKEEPYLRMDTPFRSWLATIDPSKKDSDYRLETIHNWKNTAKEIVQQIGRELVEQSGSQAFVGRGKMNAVEAFRKFRNKINNHLKGDEANVNEK